MAQADPQWSSLQYNLGFMACSPVLVILVHRSFFPKKRPPSYLNFVLSELFSDFLSDFASFILAQYVCVFTTSWMSCLPSLISLIEVLSIAEVNLIAEMIWFNAICGSILFSQWQKKKKLDSFGQLMALILWFFTNCLDQAISKFCTKVSTFPTVRMFVPLSWSLS